jgi:hypothetical protein
MAIFSFRHPAPSVRRRSSLDVPADWAETRPSEFADSELSSQAYGHASFAADPEPTVPAPLQELPAPTRYEPMAAAPSVIASRPDPGFAKNLTARAQSDELLGAGWYISSWDLMQGLDVIEGTPIDLLPPEWQRKRPRV